MSWIWKGAAIALAGLAGAGCISADVELIDARREPTPTTSLERSDVDLEDALELGSTARTERGNRITIHRFDGDVENPDPGLRFAAADAEICITPDRSDSTGVSPTFFVLELADGSTVGAIPAPDLLEPELIPARVPPGRCLRGWVFFDVEIDAVPIAVVLEASNTIKWAVIEVEG